MNTATKQRLLKAYGFEPCGHPDCDPAKPECASNRIYERARLLLNAALRNKTREELTPDDVRKVQSNIDFWLRMAGLSEATTLEQMIDSTLNVYVVLETEFRRRFPVEFAAWDAKQEREGA